MTFDGHNRAKMGEIVKVRSSVCIRKVQCVINVAVKSLGYTNTVMVVRTLAPCPLCA